MTILMTFFGIVVFIFSNFTVGFKAAFKRLWMFALTGFVIDVSVIIVSIAVGYAVTF